MERVVSRQARKAAKERLNLFWGLKHLTIFCFFFLCGFA
jgi:hypothetical protein